MFRLQRKARTWADRQGKPSTNIHEYSKGCAANSRTRAEPVEVFEVFIRGWFPTLRRLSALRGKNDRIGSNERCPTGL